MSPAAARVGSSVTVSVTGSLVPTRPLASACEAIRVQVPCGSGRRRVHRSPSTSACGAASGSPRASVPAQMPTRTSRARPAVVRLPTKGGVTATVCELRGSSIETTGPFRSPPEARPCPGGTGGPLSAQLPGSGGSVSIIAGACGSPSGPSCTTGPPPFPDAPARANRRSPRATACVTSISVTPSATDRTSATVPLVRNRPPRRSTEFSLIKASGPSVRSRTAAAPGSTSPGTSNSSRAAASESARSRRSGAGSSRPRGVRIATRAGADVSGAGACPRASVSMSIGSSESPPTRVSTSRIKPMTRPASAARPTRMATGDRTSRSNHDSGRI